MKKPFRVWADGTIIRSPRVIGAFDQGTLVKMKKYGGNNHYFAKCEHPGCSGSYNMTIVKEAGARRRRCKKHSRLVMVAGHTTNVAVLVEYASRIVWLPHKYKKEGGLVPHIRCAAPNCGSLSIFKPSVTVYKCLEHGSTHKRLRAYEALYNAWRKAHVNRNKKRSSQLANTLTYAQFVKICRRSTACHYCGVEVNRPEYNHTRLAGRGRSSYLDRVDATKGYSVDNVVTCCGSCNFSKNNFISYEEMLVIGAMRSGQKARAQDAIEQNGDAHLAWQKIVTAYGTYRNFGRQPDKKVLSAVKDYFKAQAARRRRRREKDGA